MRKLNFETLERLYNAIRAVEEEVETINKFVVALDADNKFFGSKNMNTLIDLAYSNALGGDEQLIEDFCYLLYEVPAMDGGGRMNVNGKKYPIRNFADLWTLWVETEVVSNV